MLKRKNFLIILSLVILSVIIIYGWSLNKKSDELAEYIEGNNPDIPTLVFYTTGLSTTPQIPFWAALRKGEFEGLFNLRVRMWRNTDDLQSVILAGKGDIWLGHTEGFAMAAKRGAPVSVIAITGWRKFYIITSRKDYNGIESLRNRTVAYAPPGSPGIAIFNKIIKGRIEGIKLQPSQGKELQMMMLCGKADTAILPEPLVSMLLLKNPDLRVVESLEELYGRERGTPPLMPLAGFAVNRNTAEKYPEIVKAIQESIIRNSLELKDKKLEAVKYLPEYFEKDISPEVALRSLDRDVILSKRGTDCADEINDYLKTAAPGLLDANGNPDLDSGFLWQD